jgi:hypothetical protein
MGLIVLVIGIFGGAFWEYKKPWIGKLLAKINL